MKTQGKWTTKDYHQMIEAGIFCDRHVELLTGEIVEMSPEGPSHTFPHPNHHHAEDNRQQRGTVHEHD
mgnify:CR=1 FL=1